jgi:predicted small secreted protein
MRKLLLLFLAAVGLAACSEETPFEKAEREIRNAGDKIQNAADELK